MKPVVEFFSEITDIDNRILRTIITLFRNPAKVIEAYFTGQPTYIRPLRYALSTSSLFIIAQYLYELFFASEGYGKWWLPTRIDESDTQFRNLFEILFPFQILILVIPIAIVVLKLLFLKKSWREIAVIMLYAIAQFWLLMVLLVPIIISTDADDGMIALACFTAVFVCFRNVMYGHILLRTAKWVAMTIILIIWFYHVSLNVTQYILTGFLKDYSPAVVTSPEIDPLKVVDLNAHDMAAILGDPNNRALKFEIEEKGIAVGLLNPDGSVQGETFLPGVDFVRKVLCVPLQPHQYGVLILADSAGSKSARAFLISSKGRILFQKYYRELIILNGGGLVRGTTLFLAGGRFHEKIMVPFIDVVTLQQDGDKLAEVNERNLLLLNPRQRFDDIYLVDSVKSGLTLIASKYESTKAGTSSSNTNEIVEFSVSKINLDSAIVTEWENVIFRKTSMYSPMKDKAFHMILDTTHHRILATYALANDTTLAAQLFNLNGSGKQIWKQTISEDNLTFLNYLYSDKSGIYFGGSTQSGISNPITFAYRQALLGHISADGKKVSTMRYGKTRQGNDRLFTKLVVSDSITVYSVNSRLGYLGPQTDCELLTFKNDFAEGH